MAEGQSFRRDPNLDLAVNILGSATNAFTGAKNIFVCVALTCQGTLVSHLTHLNVGLFGITSNDFCLMEIMKNQNNKKKPKRYILDIDSLKEVSIEFPRFILFPFLDENILLSLHKKNVIQ